MNHRIAYPKWCLATIVLMLLWASGCSHEAHVTKQDGERVKGVVIDSSYSAIVFQNPDTGATAKIERRDIAAIRHPGENGPTAAIVGIVVGSVFTLLGGGLLLNIATSDAGVNADPMGIVSFAGSSFAVIGISTVVGSTAGYLWSRSAHRNSVERALPPSESSAD